jgi:hypothetical protein
MRYLALAFLLALFMPALGHANQVVQANYNKSEARAVISNATAYLTTVNESAYLIFYPKLKQAYSYLNTSQLLLNSSPNASVEYANLAVASARSAYENINVYRDASVVVATILTVITALFLYRFMKPVKKTRS